MIESQYTSALHKKVPPSIYKWKICDTFAGGVPDAFYRSLGATAYKPLWVEYKFLKSLPKRDTTLVIPNLSAQQLIWLKQAVKAGEQVLVIVGVEDQKCDKQTAGFVMAYEEWEAGITSFEAWSRLQSMSDLAQRITNICECGGYYGMA